VSGGLRCSQGGLRTRSPDRAEAAAKCGWERTCQTYRPRLKCLRVAPSRVGAEEGRGLSTPAAVKLPCPDAVHGQQAPTARLEQVTGMRRCTGGHPGIKSLCPAAFVAEQQRNPRPGCHMTKTAPGNRLPTHCPYALPRPHAGRVFARWIPSPASAPPSPRRRLLVARAGPGRPAAKAPEPSPALPPPSPDAPRRLRDELRRWGCGSRGGVARREAEPPQNRY
jgi:hypothetical protein